MANDNLRIGISMRVTDAIGYEEKRDSLAQDWSKFMLEVFPEEQWLSIPNIGIKASDYARKWALNAFIFSGGENVGASASRDLTEFTLLDYALKNNFPVLGVCRGLQLIYSRFGGKVELQNSDFGVMHRATTHDILIDKKLMSVNSYHDNKLIENTLPNEFKVLAICNQDKSIEAVTCRNILGIMWHPEREFRVQQWEVELIKNFLNKFN